MIIGIFFIIIEIFDPAFFFIAFGVGAIATGLLCLFNWFGGQIVLQIFVFAVISFIAFLLSRKLGKKVLSHPTSETNVFALKGKTGLVTSVIPVDGKGYVKIGGEEWPAIHENNLRIELSTKVVVTGIEGNKLIVVSEAQQSEA